MSTALVDQYSEAELKNIVANSHSMREVVQKLGYNTVNGKNSATVKARIQKYDIDTSHFTSTIPQERTEENVFCEDSTASQAVLRRWYIKGEYTPYICSICGQEPIWQGKELTLILDHINGKNHDDRLENLRWVCPNCNQQLDTTGFKKIRTQDQLHKKYYCSQCGKEISHGTYTGMCSECAAKSRRTCEWPDRETLKELIRTKPFTRIAEQYGVTDNTIRKWCDHYGLPRNKSAIESYDDNRWGLV